MMKLQPTKQHRHQSLNILALKPRCRLLSNTHIPLPSAQTAAVVVCMLQQSGRPFCNSLQIEHKSSDAEITDNRDKINCKCWNFKQKQTAGEFNVSGSICRRILTEGVFRQDPSSDACVVYSLHSTLKEF